MCELCDVCSVALDCGHEHLALGRACHAVAVVSEDAAVAVVAEYSGHDDKGDDSLPCVAAEESPVVVVCEPCDVRRSIPLCWRSGSSELRVPDPVSPN